jgi:hypothetical protein
VLNTVHKCRLLYRSRPLGLRAPKQLLDILLNTKWGGGGRIAIHHATLLVNQEFGEVPLDAITEKPTFVRLQILVQGCSIVTVDINLVKNGILSLEASASKLDNLLIGAGFLPSKLIARESQYLKALDLVLLIQLAQLSVVGVS